MNAPILPDGLYDKKTLFTLSGSSVSVWLLTMVLSHAFDFNEGQKIVALVVALALSFIGAVQIRKLDLSLATVAFFNGLLIYITAVGIDAVNHGYREKAKSVQKTDSTAQSLAILLPFVKSPAWWPSTQMLDSINQYRQKNDSLQAVILNLLTLSKDSPAAVEPPNNCIPYLQEIETLKSRIKIFESRKIETPPKTNDVITQNEVNTSGQIQALLRLLEKLESENSKTLKYAEQYLNADFDKPIAKKEALGNLNETTFAFRHALIDLDGQLKSLKSQLEKMQAGH